MGLRVCFDKEFWELGVVVWVVLREAGGDGRGWSLMVLAVMEGWLGDGQMGEARFWNEFRWRGFAGNGWRRSVVLWSSPMVCLTVGLMKVEGV
ncbi:hypothetical protein V6N11_049789 [Hibiscus sabdariffa]|uniref:Transmembrane protein n=1 Tax=Hibiscus sabdariffa TaxID=183260 RepID=A0ABR2T8B2_9ROSI